MNRQLDRVHSARNTSHCRRLHFTLIEIMIVVGVIGLLAAIALPAFARARVQAQCTRFANDIRVAANMFEIASFELHGYPSDTTPGRVPTGMEDFLCDFPWAAETVLGGNWDWDCRQFGFTAGVSVYRPRADDKQMAEVDRILDDGNLASGIFRQRSDGYMYIIEF